MNQRAHGKFLTLLLALVATGAQGYLYADSIDDMVMAEMAQQHIPGLALAVMQDGRVIRSAGYGLASIELNVPVTTQTVFKIGSISKQFLASGLMILVQEGKVRLDDSASKYLEDAPPAWSGITLRHLLSHTNGIVREGPAFDAAKVQPDIQVIRSAYPLALQFAPGAQWMYSNVGYFSLGEILSRLSGEPWPEFMERRVFRPLAMNATRTTSGSAIVPNRADGYEWRDGALQRHIEWHALRPSGAFLSTVEDLAKWDAALYTEAPLTRASREEMWTPVALNDGSSSAYGLGWDVQVRAGKRSVHHEGWLAGFRAYFARFPDERLSFVVLTNEDMAATGRILWKLAAAWLPGVDQGPPDGRPTTP